MNVLIRKNNFKKKYVMFSSSHNTCILKTRAEKKEVRYRQLEYELCENRIKSIYGKQINFILQAAK